MKQETNQKENPTPTEKALENPTPVKGPIKVGDKEYIPVAPLNYDKANGVGLYIVVEKETNGIWPAPAFILPLKHE